MSLRHEHKHIISHSDRCILRQRLSAVMKPDKNGLDGKYKIRSLYFDNLHDTALLEKIDGVNVREKFRLRYYNGNLSYIVLEKKSKINGLCRKESIPLTVNEVEKILNGDTSWMAESKIELLNELYSKMKSKGLMPKTSVDYERFCAVIVVLDDGCSACKGFGAVVSNANSICAAVFCAVYCNGPILCRTRRYIAA